MKTFNGKSISKKAIEKIIRTMDPTQIFRLYVHIYGVKAERAKVMDFIKEFAPSEKAYRSAYRLAYPDKHMMERYHLDLEILQRHGFYQGDKKQRIVAYLKEQCEDVKSPYAKRPMYGRTGLYFCSPVYGHQDYNKHRMLDLEGNEKFCRLVIAYGNKFFGPVYDKQ